MKCDYCGFSAFGKHKCLSCGAPMKVFPLPTSQQYGSYLGDYLQAVQMQNQNPYRQMAWDQQQALNCMNGILGARIFG